VRLTKDQVRLIYDQGFEAVYHLYEMLQDQIDKLEQRVARLEQKDSKDSHNSSKPPSTDGFKREPHSLRERTGRKQGGQIGHKGTTLERVENPDHIVIHKCEGSCQCGRSLKYAERIDVEKRQVFDLPPIKIEVTEHQAEIVECRCGEKHTARFPEDVNAPTQYGKGINALAIYLMIYQLLPSQRTQELFSTLLNVNISQGTLKNICKEAYNRLESTEEMIINNILDSPVAHADETGFYVNGTRWWLHNVSTILYTFYFCHIKRGRDAMKAAGVLPKYKGRLIHDYWKAYLDYLCEHGLCNAHHLRELVFINETFKEEWAAKMKHLLLTIKNAVEYAVTQKSTTLRIDVLRRYRRQYHAIIREGYQCQPLANLKRKPGQRGRLKQTPAKNLLDRFKKHADDVLAFMYDFSVPFSNNLAERDIRMMKVQQKISGCFRSELGAQVFCRIRGFISTVKKHKLNVIDHLSKVFTLGSNETVFLPE
jgi:transposase